MRNRDNNFKLFSEYDFIRLYSAIIAKNRYYPIINHHDLEKKIYNFYHVEEFKELFVEVGKKEDILFPEENKVLLSEGFLTALTYGILVNINDTGEMRSVITLIKDEAEKIISNYDERYVAKMTLLVENVIKEEKKKESEKAPKVKLKKAPEEGYEITDEEMEIINRLNGPKKDEFDKLYLSSEDYDRIYQNVVGDVLEVTTKPQENKELTELADGLKKARQELVKQCETNPEQAKELAIEALIRTGVIESSDKIEKGKVYTKERKNK